MNVSGKILDSKGNPASGTITEQYQADNLPTGRTWPFTLGYFNIDVDSDCWYDFDSPGSAKYSLDGDDLANAFINSNGSFTIVLVPANTKGSEKKNNILLPVIFLAGVFFITKKLKKKGKR